MGSRTKVPFMFTQLLANICIRNIWTHWGRDKMAAILRWYLKIPFTEFKNVFIIISQNFVTTGSINNSLALVQITAWRQATSHYLKLWRPRLFNRHQWLTVAYLRSLWNLNVQVSELSVISTSAKARQFSRCHVWFKWLYPLGDKSYRLEIR